MPEPSMPDARPLLAVDNLEAWYGESHVLHGVTFDVQAGEVVTLLGRNGVGKTTLIKILCGDLPPEKGKLTWGYEAQIGTRTDQATS